MSNAKLFSIQEVPEASVPEARKRLKTLVAQAPEEWNRLTKAVVESELKNGKALKVNLESAAGKLKGVKHPQLVILRNLKRFVREQQLPRHVFLREGAIYVGVRETRKGRRAAA